jgi:ELWxxDGT repeat protein
MNPSTNRHKGTWSRMRLLMTVLAALALVWPVQAATSVRLVKDINPVMRNLSSGPGDFASIGSMLFFGAYDGVHGRELWKSDGTEEGTLFVEDIEPGAAGSSPSGFTRAGRTIFFRASTLVAGTELWAAGTELLAPERQFYLPLTRA